MSDDPQDNEDDEVEWITIKDAALLTKQKSRTVRDWEDKGKIRSRTFEDRVNAPIYVALSDVEELAGDVEETPPETLSIPVAAWEHMKELEQRAFDQGQRAMKAEREAEFFRMRWQEATNRKRHWWQRHRPLGL